MQRTQEDLFSIVGMGVVVLITGYLWMDGLRSLFTQKYTELLNLKKAVYTATKKDTAEVTRLISELMERLERLEQQTQDALLTVTQLQTKALEGQKNSLNYNLNYNKENTKQIIATIEECSKKGELLALLSKLNDRLEGYVLTAKENTEEEYLGKVVPASESIHKDSLKITPLYEDPNKNLTTDEIASLFASFGQ